ncbi:MAG: EAL domain-containing protein [Vicinamibacterales bacterium]
MPGAQLQWHRRLEARVAGVLGLLVAGAVGTMLTVTTDSVSRQSRERAAQELEVARIAFYNDLQTRTSSAMLASQLITELPVFRAHFTDSRLASDHLTIEAMAEGYRQQLAAQFVVVGDASGEWLASPGWPDVASASNTPEELGSLVETARGGTSGGGVIGHEGKLFLVVSSPARFADEVLGTLTIGFELTDALAVDLARIAHCEVVAMLGDQIAAASVSTQGRTELAGLAARLSTVGSGVHDGLYTLGDRQFIAGTFELAPGETVRGGRLLLLADWKPTEQFVDRLRGRFLTAGAAAFGLELAVGLVFSRSVSRPLRDIASAASRIADGELALQLPVHGSAEAMTVAHAFNDMSSRLRVTRDRLEHDAIHDGLTQLPNRVLFMERLERAMARRANYPDYRFAVLFLDLDRFKHVNDSLGHSTGDTLLVAFAERLAGAVRRNDVVARPNQPDTSELATDTLARFGGDEFVILLDDIHDPIDAVRVAERVQHESRMAFAVGEHEVFATVSIGLAVSSAVHRTGEDVVRDADLAMYRAKSAGGGSYAVFDDTMHEAAVERLRLETELRHAIERHEFCLYYQPIVSLTDGSVKGFEALIRWRHPERGLVAPSGFLHVAEQIGLMTTIDEWALREACRQIREWQLESPEREPPSVSVNLSSKAFGSSALVDLVASILTSVGIPARCLRIEVTEGVAMAEPLRTRQTLGDLRALGVRVSLDDFGTGYCSLSYLQQFPVDTLKIDRSFVQQIGEAGGTEIVRLIVALAQTLGLEVVAEGTEEAGQVEYLRELGCGFSQGYYFGRPVSPAQVAFTSVMKTTPRPTR